MPKNAASVEPRQKTSSPATGDPVHALAELLNAASTLSGHVARPASPDSERLVEIAPDVWAGHLVDALFDRMLVRFPKPGKQCQFTGLNRNQIYELSSGKAPAIQTLSLREPGERGGARFFFVGSALRYLRRLSEEQSSSTHNKKRYGDDI